MQNQPSDRTLSNTREMALHAGGDACMLTTFDRDSGMAHDVEMRFASRNDRIYMLSDEGGNAHWVQNLLRNPEVSVRLGTESAAGMARVMADGPEAEVARQLLAAKYEGWREGQQISDWARNSLPVAIDMAAGRQASGGDGAAGESRRFGE